MLFLVVSFVLVGRPLFQRCIVSLVLAFAVEVSHLYQAPWIDDIRSTTLGGLVLGFCFLWSDLVCYLVGLAAGVSADRLLWPTAQRENSPEWHRAEFSVEQLSSTVSEAGRNFTSDKRLGQSFRVNNATMGTQHFRNNGGEQRGHSTFELINSYGNVLLHPMLVSATVMAKCVPENVEVVCPHELPVNWN